MWFVHFLVLSSIFTQFAVAKCTASRVKIAFVIDSSGSVIEVEGNFLRQIKIANSVLSAMRDIFLEADADDKLEWGAIEFGTQAKVVRPMHVSTGNFDNIDEYMDVQCKGNLDLTENWASYCGTSYVRSLGEAISMLGDEEDVKLFIWILSDGIPGDSILPSNNLTDTYKLKTFREEKLDAKEIKTVCSFLAPQNAAFFPLANSTMRALCNDEVLVDELGDSFDAAAYTKKAEKMFSDAVKTQAFVCEPAVWILVAIIVAAIIGACCCAGAKAKQHFLSEDTEKRIHPQFRRRTKRPDSKSRVGKKPRLTNRKGA